MLVIVRQNVYRKIMKMLFHCGQKRLLVDVFSSFVVAAMFLFSIHSTAVLGYSGGDLYSAQVAVASQSSASEKEAMSAALATVLVKVTGQTSYLDNETLKAALAEPARYVKGYSYRREKGKPQSLYLQVNFLPEPINRLLREIGLPIWGGARPTTLFWLAVRERNQRFILRDGDVSPLVKQLDAQLSNRSLPFIFPLMDVEDDLAVSPVDIWGGFVNKLAVASRRYGTDTLLVGRLTLIDGVYQGHLTLVFRGKREAEADIERLTVDQLSLVAADLVGGALAKHYAVADSGSKQVTKMVVERVNSYKAYSDLLSYIKGLAAVRSVAVRGLTGTTVEVELSIDGDNTQLVDFIALSRRLKQVKKPENDGETNLSLYYRWVQ